MYYKEEDFRTFATVDRRQPLPQVLPLENPGTFFRPNRVADKLDSCTRRYRLTGQLAVVDSDEHTHTEKVRLCIQLQQRA